MHGAGFLFFVFGAIFGSFLNVVALRYESDKPLFGGQLFGRSHCPHCNKTLRFFELIPILSFFILRGKCARCKSPLSLAYPMGELATALSFATIPGIVMKVFPGSLLDWTAWGIAAVIAAAFASLIVAALVDLRLFIIPDEIHYILIILAVVSGFLMAPHFGPARGAYTGGYSLIFGFHDTLLPNRILGAVVGGVFFLALYFVTLKRGMGLGDVKLAASIGLFMGWPDGFLACMLAFCFGTAVMLPMLLLRRTRLKSYVPFGPFLSLAAIVVMIWGDSILRGYFHLFRG